MRYLGLDLGTKTLGIAISDKTNTIATKLKVIRYDEKTKEEMFLKLQKIIEEKKITDIVLGLPKNMDNSLGFAAQRSLDFKQELEKKVDVNIHLMDERLTTKEAEAILLSADVSRKKRKKVIDALAATIILEAFLKMKGNEKDGRK